MSIQKQLQALKPVFKKAAGIILLIIGILALVIPFTPGFLLILVGLELLGLRIILWEWIKKWTSKK